MKCCTVLAAFFLPMMALIQADDECGGALSIANGTRSIAPKDACNIHVTDTSYLLFELLELQPNDKISVELPNKTVISLNPQVLPLVDIPANSTLQLELDPGNNEDPRRIKAKLLPSCNYAMENVSTPMQLPSPQSLSSPLNCTIRLDPDVGLKLSISMVQLQLEGKSKLTIVHKDNTKDEVHQGDACDYIEEAGSLVVVNITSASDKVVLHAEPVNAECSGETTLTNEAPLNLVLPLPNKTSSDLECRQVIHHHGNQSLVGRLSLTHTDNTSYLHVHNGGSTSSPTLFLQGPNSIQEGYFVANGESLLLRYRDMSGVLQVNASDSSIYVSKPSNITVDKNSVYLLELPGKSIVLNGPTELKNSLQLYSDFKDSAHLMDLPAGPLNYPLVSSTSRLMVKSGNGSSMEFTLSDIPVPGCYKMTLGPSDTYGLDREHCSETCEWIVPPQANAGELALHISNAHLVNPDAAKVYLLGDKDPLMENLQGVIREIYLPAKSGFKIKVSRNCSLDSVLQATYDIQPACSKTATIEPGRDHTVTSPNFPDFYPFNADCNTTLTTKGKALLLTVDHLDLEPGHALQYGESGKKVTVTKSMDVLVEESAVWINLCGHGSKRPLDPSGRTASGFNLTVTAAECGKATTASMGALSSGNATSCIWTVQLANNTLLNYSVSVPKGGHLELHNGPSLRSPLAAQHDNHSLSLTPYMVVVYHKLNATTPFTLEYSSYKCEEYCKNNLCMHPGWQCNGHNDCGDWSDEIYCNGTTPTPTSPPRPAPAPTPGWSSGSFAAAIILSLIVGLTLAYAAPILYNRYRMTTYQPFGATLE